METSSLAPRLRLTNEHVQLPLFHQAVHVRDETVQRFVAEQQRYAQHYAKDGAELAAKWNIDRASGHPTDLSAEPTPTAIASKDNSRISARFGLSNVRPSDRAILMSSPLLQARVPGDRAVPLDRITSQMAHSRVLADTVDNLPHKPSIDNTAKTIVSVKKPNQRDIAHTEDLYLDDHEARTCGLFDWYQQVSLRICFRIGRKARSASSEACYPPARSNKNLHCTPGAGTAHRSASVAQTHALLTAKIEATEETRQATAAVRNCFALRQGERVSYRTRWKG